MSILKKNKNIYNANPVVPSAIVVKGARVHNLKNINVEIPRGKLVVLTGLSGSGKSSLAFDTIYAEGQRRYVESLSSYARQFLGLIDKPDVDSIEGLSPAISIDQKTSSHNPRSTVGTVTEIYDYLRLLFARIGTPTDPVTGAEISSQSASQIAARISKYPLHHKIMIVAPLIRDQKGEHRALIIGMARKGISRFIINGVVVSSAEAEVLTLDKKKRHTIGAVIDRIVIEDIPDIARIAASLESALSLGQGFVEVHDITANTVSVFAEKLVIPSTGLAFPPLEPRLFSFNSPHGACPACAGLGTRMEVDPDLVIPNKKLSIAQGAVRPWQRILYTGWQYKTVEALAREYNFSLNVPVEQMKPEHLEIVLYGVGGRVTVNLNSTAFKGQYEAHWEGVIPNLERRYKETDSDTVRRDVEQYMRVLPCPECKGARLKPEALAVKVDGKSIRDISEMSVVEALKWVTVYKEKLTQQNKGDSKEGKVAYPIIKEVCDRLSFLHAVGLGYLTLHRSAVTLSGGESQRIRLATQIGSALTGVIYILDEPSIGLHQRDNDKLITTLQRLRDLGNTVLVVEHDEDTMRASDWLIDIGPGAGEHGGRIVAEGTPEEVIKNNNSLTGSFLSGKSKVFETSHRRKGNGLSIIIEGATANNLKNITVEFPLGKLIAVTGVSGSGKSTLTGDIFASAISSHLYKSKEIPGAHKAIHGLENIDKLVVIDQSPIGRTPRSNPATYTGVFDPIRGLFAAMPEAKARGYGPGRFSFNVKGGRCETCEGDGVLKVEMNFLPDIYVECEECHGKRYNPQTLEITYHGKTIADVLQMNVGEALIFFDSVADISRKLKTLDEVGLGYLKLGQSANTLSGGEAQRIKLATELSRRPSAKTMYLLDEPTTGLHFADVDKLLRVLHTLVDRGSSMIVVEHNLDVIKAADWVIDLGPDGGDKGGQVVACGTPEEVARSPLSWTGYYLARVMGIKRKRPPLTSAL